MPNQYSPDREKVVYIEDKETKAVIEAAAKKAGISTAALYRAITKQFVERIQSDPNFRIILPLFVKE